MQRIYCDAAVDDARSNRRELTFAAYVYHLRGEILHKEAIGAIKFFSQDYDKDNIPERTVAAIAPFMDNPDFEPKAIAKASKVRAFSRKFGGDQSLIQGGNARFPFAVAACFYTQ